MLEARRRQHAAPRRALDQPLLQQIGLDHLFQGVAAFRQGGGQGVDADRPAVKFDNDRIEDPAVHGVQAQRIDFEELQGLVRHLGGQDSVGAERAAKELSTKTGVEIKIDWRTPPAEDGTVQGHFVATGVRPRVLTELTAKGIKIPSSYFDPGHPL